MAVCLVGITKAFDSIGCDRLQLIGLRMEGQMQMLWWTSSATDNWFREIPKMDGKSFNNMRVQII